MRRVALAIVSTVTGLVMLLTFKTHSTSTGRAPAAIGNADTGGTDDNTGTGAGTPSSSSASSSSSPSSASTTKTVTGDAADTPYGPVQVKITVKDRKITGVSAVDYPNSDPRDQEINSNAIPQLNRETLSAQTARIDTVSGATYTSDGYVSSLQSALNKAGL